MAGIGSIGGGGGLDPSVFKGMLSSSGRAAESGPVTPSPMTGDIVSISPQGQEMQSNSTSSFGDMIAGAIQNLDAGQQSAAQASQDVATGQSPDPTQSLLQIEQASISMQLAVQMRNKAVEAYQEVMRMQL